MRSTRCFAAVLVLSAVLVAAPGLPSTPAAAGVADNFSVVADNNVDSRALIGENVTFTLTATGDHASASPLYNLSFRAVVPVGFEHVSASPEATEVLTDVPSIGETTIIWSNVSDLPANSQAHVELTVDTNPDFTGGITGSTTAPVGDFMTTSIEAVASLNAFLIPDYDLGTGVFTGDFDGSGTTTDVVEMIPFRVTTTGATELLRGVHQNGFESASGTTGADYTIVVENNPDYEVDTVTLTGTLDPGLEFLGCDNYYASDNTTVGEEWLGSGVVATGTGCGATALTTPETVATGSGGETVVTWYLGDLTPSATVSVDYRAGIALYENRPFSGSPPTEASLDQGRNLDNNTGTSTGELDRSVGADPELLTANEQLQATTANATGTYVPTAAGGSDSDVLVIESEDIIITKSMGGALVQGTNVVTTLTISTSEYRDFTNLIVRDLLPSSMCFMGTFTTDNTSGGSDWNTTDCVGSGTIQSTIGGSPVDVAEVRELPSGGPYGSGRFEIVWDFSDPQNAALADLDSDNSLTITYTAVVRDFYRGSLAQLPGEEVLAGDRATNEAEVEGPDTIADMVLPADPVDPDGGADGDTAWDELTNTLPSLNKRISVKAGPLANGSGATGSTCGVSYGSITWAEGNPTPELGFGPGDIICFELGATFPAAIDYEGVQLQDLLPAGYTYVAGSATRIATTDTLAATSITESASVVTFTLDGTGEVEADGHEFLWVVAAEMNDNTLGQANDIEANLEKMVHNNNAGLVFQYRDQAEAEWTEPEVRLATGVDTVNAGASNGPDYDTSLSGGSTAAIIRAGDVVTYRVDVWNIGNSDAVNTEVQDVLNTEFVCGDISAISNGGSCSAGIITWTGLTVAASTGGGDLTPDDETTAPVTLTYDLTVPVGVDPAHTWANNAGVATYQGSTNAGTFDYYPASNIDPANSAFENTDAADDPAYIVSPTPIVLKGQQSGIAETGNSSLGFPGSADEQATIGEIVLYEVTLVIPHGTSVYNGTVFDVLPAGLTYFAGNGLFDGSVSNLQPSVSSPSGTGALTVGSVVHNAGTVSYDLPASHTNAAGSGDDLVTIAFYAQVSDVGGNVADPVATDLANQGAFDWEDSSANNRPDVLSSTVHTHVVEVNPILVKDHTVPLGATVSPGQTVTYRVTVTNPTSANNVSVGHDLTIVDGVPAGLTPLGLGAVPVSTNGDTVPSTGVLPAGSFDGTWSETNRTITWSNAEWSALESIDPDATIQLTYDVEVDDPAVTSSILTNTASLTLWTLDQDATPTPDPNAGDARGYSGLEADTVNLPLASITKDIEPFNAGDALDDISGATIGEPVGYEVEVDIPSGTAAYDATIFDVLPPTLDFDQFASIAPGTECEIFDSGTGSTTGISLTDSDVETFNPAGGDAQTAAWFLGDIYANGICTINVRYSAHLNTTAFDTDSVTNSANIAWNTTNQVADQTPLSLQAGFNSPGSGSWANTDGPVTQSFTVTEPAIDIDKDVATTAGGILVNPTCDSTPGNNTGGGDDADGAGGNGCDTSAGAQLRYTVTATSSGTNDAHDLTIVDTVPVGVTPLLSPGGALATTDGQTITGNSGSTGIWNETGRTITWAVAGPIAPAGAATLDYDVEIDASDTILRDADLTNTVDLSTYYGISAADRGTIITNNPANDDIVTYGNDVSATRGPVTTDSVIVEVHFPQLSVTKAPTSGDPTDVRRDVPFSWTVVVTNTDAVAAAYNVNVSDVLPAGWTYDTASAQVTTPHNGGPAAVDPACSPDAGSCGDAAVLNTETLDWALLVSGPAEPLAPGQTVTITFTATPQSAALTPDQITGEAYTSYDGGGGFAHTNNASTDGEDVTTSATCCDPDGAGGTPPEQYGDTDTDDVFIARADIEVAKTVSPIEGDSDPSNGPYWFGSYIEYTVTVDNLGPDDATNVTVSDVLNPVELEYDSVVSVDQGTYDDGSDIWTIGTATSGATLTLTLRTRIVGLGAIANIAQAETVDQYDSDSVPANSQPAEDDQDTVSITSTPVTLGDFVWLDLNGDGVQDVGEPGIPGVQVDITWSDPGDSSPQSYSVTTAADGSFTVPSGAGLPSYSDITVTINTGLSPNLVGLTPSFDRDGTGTPHVSTDQVTSADTTTPGGVLADLEFDYGYVPDGAQTIGDVVWWDVDLSADPTDGVGEPALPNIDVSATWAGWDDIPGNGDDLVFTDTTDPSGNYLFDVVAPGDYQIAVNVADIPSGMTQTYDLDGTGTPNVVDITLDPAEIQNDVDFSYAGAGTVGDTVWFDHDGDTSIGAGEPGLGAVTVTLVWVGADATPSTIDDVTLSDATALDGTYSFANLPHGDYTVTVDDATLPGAMIQTYDSDGTGTAHTSGVTLSGGSPSDADQDFGYRGTGSIGDTVFFDIDASEADGVPDAGDSGVPNIAVTVTWAGADGTPGNSDDFAAIVTTDVSGDYLVPSLPHGDYTIVVDDTDLPAGLATATYDSDGTGTAHTSGVTLSGGTPDDLTQDFSYTGEVAGLIGDRVWLDQDNDGVDDPGEVGISGVTVTLVWFGADGSSGGGDDVTQTTTTVTDGGYVFDNLPEGNFTITVDDTDLPAGLAPTVDADGTGTAHTSATVLDTGNPSSLDQDFGYAGAGSLGDTVWYDIDGSGTPTADVGESGLGGIDITVVWANPQGDDATYTVATDADGLWGVTDLPHGTFTVTIDDTSLPGGMTPTYDDDGTGSPHGSTVVLNVSTPDDLDQDFSYTGAGSVGDTVWFDQDDDGAADPVGSGVFTDQDQALESVELTVTWGGLDGVIDDDAGTPGTDESLDDVEFGATTDNNGEWLVTNLPHGAFSVVVDTDTLPAGIDVPTFDADGTTTAHSAVLILDGGTPDDLDQDFSYTGAGSVGDTVWFDLDGDGSVGGDEVGLAGIDVTLDYSGPSGVSISVAAVSDLDGAYTFGQLPLDTNMSISLDDTDIPPGFSPTYDGDGIVSPHTSATILTTLVRDDLSQDFGYNGAGSIGDIVFFDRDGAEDDGVPGADDVAIPNADVTIVWTNPTGGSDMETAVTTDSDGAYLLTGLPYGDYTVQLGVATIPAGTTATYDADGVGTALVSGTTLDGVTTDDLDQDFAVTGTGSLGDTVWTDVDGDGVFDESEAGIDGVVVSIVYSDPISGLTFTDETTTSGGGTYQVGNLPEGDYSITIDDLSLPAGSVPTHDVDGVETPHQTAAPLVAAEDRTDVDFGYRREADLAILKTSTGEFAIGSENIWTISVVNDGPAPAASPVVVSDVLPDGVTFIGTGSDSWSCAAVVQDVTCTFVATGTSDPVDMASGSGSTFDMIVSVDVAAATGVTNTASVTSPTVDPDETDNSDDDEVAVPLSIINIDKSLQDSLQVGGDATYELTVTNLGPSESRGDVVVVDELPSALSYSSSATSIDGATCTHETGAVTCTNPNVMAVGAIWTIDLSVNVSGGSGSQVTNNATVAGGNEVAETVLPQDVLDEIYAELRDGDGTLAGELGIAPESDPDGQDGANGTVEPTSPALARTGATILGLLVAAVLLIALGAAIVFGRRHDQPELLRR
ncbi:MAG: isopeptide-forming domain-containing fimbrial protein [Actinomycetia bacterium]|nr:isopeptide-forming domain-containing fimbrial protein [Actinomycetes bacterium]